MTQSKSKSKPAKSCPHCRGQGYALKNHDGYTQAVLCDCFHCERCHDRGQVFLENEAGVSFMKECECEAFKKRLARIGDAGIPGKYATVSLGTYHGMNASQKMALRVAKDFIKDFPELGKSGLLLMGRPGVGKTHIGAAILKELILTKGVDGRFVDFFQLLSDIRHGYSQDLSEQAIINPYVHAPVLVIDELAKGRNTEWELTMLDQIISSRYNFADKVTLFTTNFFDAAPERGRKSKSKTHVDTSEEFAARTETLEDKIGERVYSRLMEMCRFVKIDGDDYRKGMAGQRPEEK